jgi:hypothetical protein
MAEVSIEIKSAFIAVALALFAAAVITYPSPRETRGI